MVYDHEVLGTNYKIFKCPSARVQTYLRKVNRCGCFTFIQNYT